MHCNMVWGESTVIRRIRTVPPGLQNEGHDSSHESRVTTVARLDGATVTSSDYKGNSHLYIISIIKYVRNGVFLPQTDEVTCQRVYDAIVKGSTIKLMISYVAMQDRTHCSSVWQS